MSNALGNRAQGQIPISIATSLALESLFGIMEDKPKTPAPILKFDALWINMRTLIRNIDGAIESGLNHNTGPLEYYKAMFSEMRIISAKISELGENAPALKFYASSYKSLSRRWPKAMIRENTSDRAIRYAKLENTVLGFIDEDIKAQRLSKEIVALYDMDLALHCKAGALISHLPIDLLLATHGHFDALVESHTGAIKKKSDWNTKLRDGRKHPRIPFDKGMIQLFGDSANMLSPQTLDIRKKMDEIAEKFNWNSLTTKERILLCVKGSNEPILYELVKAAY